MSELLSVWQMADPWLVGLLLFPLGLVTGSFCNVLWHRIPQGESVIWSRSRCPACRRPLGAGDLVPVLSFLCVGGRCRYCRSPISWRYPLLELVTGSVTGVAGVAGGWVAGLVALLSWVSGVAALAVVRRRSLWRDQSGLSLVEVLVSLFLLMLVVGPAFEAIRVSHESALAVQRRTLAVGLARDRIAYLSAEAVILTPGTRTWTYAGGGWTEGSTAGYVVTAVIADSTAVNSSRKAWRVVVTVTCTNCLTNGPKTGAEVRLAGVVHE